MLLHGPNCRDVPTWHVFDGVEETVFLGGVFNVRIDEQAVHFRVNVLDGDLEAVEASGFRHLDFLHESFDEIFVDDAVAGGEKRQHVGEEVTFVVLERLPVAQIAAEIHFLDGPKRSFGFLVHLPNVRELDGKDDEAARIGSKKRFVGKVNFLLRRRHRDSRFGFFLLL